MQPSTTRRFRAPGRVNLIGEHTDYSGGLVLPAAIDRAVYVEVLGPSDRIQLTSDRSVSRVDTAADGSELERAQDWGRYVAATAAQLHDLGCPPTGFRGRVTSDLPDGAGLSSSAALEVAIAVTITTLADFGLDGLELAQACQRAEMAAVGVPCGIMDQAASVLGRAGSAVLLDCATLDHRAVTLPEHLAIVILSSGVRRELASSGYSQRREELEMGLHELRIQHPSEITPEELDRVLTSAALDPMNVARVRHVVTENQRVRDVVTVLESDEPIDTPSLGRLFSASHASLRDDFEVSTPEVDRLVELALGHGSVAARMTGGGFGGAIVALTEVENADGFAERVVSDYRREYPDLESSSLIAKAAAGAGPVESRTLAKYRR